MKLHLAAVGQYTESEFPHRLPPEDFLGCYVFVTERPQGPQHNHSQYKESALTRLNPNNIDWLRPSSDPRRVEVSRQDTMHRDYFDVVVGPHSNHLSLHLP